jgi:hypothetical protein
LPILRDWLADSRRLGALGRVTAVDGFDPVLGAEKKARQEARTKKKGLRSDSSPTKDTKKDKLKAKAEQHGSLGKAIANVEKRREEAMEAVGKDESKNKSKSGAPRMAMARHGSSVSSIGSEVLGPGRRSSVSSGEIEGVLKEASAGTTAGGETSKEGA